MKQLTNHQLHIHVIHKIYTFFKIYQKFLLPIKFKFFYCLENTNRFKSDA